MGRNRRPAVVPARPVKLEITMTESELVKELRTQTADYRAQIQQLEERCRRAEYEFKCASVLNLRIYDWLRANKIKVPKEITRVKDLHLL